MQAVLLITGAALWCGALVLLNRDISTPVKEQVRRALNEWKSRFEAYCSLKWKVGFTLIELAIVLVIIGLIVGGVLVGYRKRLRDQRRQSCGAQWLHLGTHK